jgi:hypothetical protein
MRVVARLPRPAREPWIVLGALVLVQWAALAVFALVVQHNGWLYYQGGDQTFFYTDSWVLSHGHIPESKVGYAWSLVLAPLTWLFGPSFLNALPAIVLLQTIVLLPIALLGVYGIAARVGGRSIGYLAAGLWVVAPYASIPLFIPQYHDKYVEQFLPQAFGLTGLGDFPSTVCLIVAAYFTVRALDTGAPAEAALAGLAAGFAIGIKPANALFLAGPLLAFLAARRWRDGLAFGGALAAPLLALLIWKARGLGYIPVLTPDNQALGVGLAALPPPLPLAVVVSKYVHFDWTILHNNFLYLREVFWSVRLVQWLPVAGFLAAARLSVPKALLLGGWFSSFVLVKASSPGGSLEEGTLLRLIMPSLPPFIVLMAAIPLLVPTVGPRIAERFPVRTTPVRWRSRPAIAAAIAFGLVPLAVLGVLTPLRDGRAATLSQSSVFIPTTQDVHLRVIYQGRVEVRWRPHTVGSVDTFYTVFRSPARFKVPKGSPDEFPTAHQGLLCQPRSHGASVCSIEMEQIGNTRGTFWADGPGHGRWTYRVGVAGNWRNDQQAGDTMLISEPVTVTVP